MSREISLDSLSAKGIVQELWHNAWLIIVFALSVWFGITGVGKLLYTPEYTVSSTVVVSIKGNSDTYSSLSTATQMADVIAEVFQSDVMQQLVREDTGRSMEARISCSQIQETNLLVIDAKSDNPRDAYLFLNAALNHYDEVSSYVFSNASLEILKEPSVPTSPSNRPRFSGRKNEITILAALCMAGVIVLFYMFRFTLKSSAVASSQLDGAILGVIPYEKNPVRSKKKNKVALLISSRIVSMNFAESTRRAQMRIEHHLRKQNKQVLLVTSVNENEGKSTIAANIAIAFAEKQKKVLLIDGDLMKPAQYKVFERKLKSNNPFEALLMKKISVEQAITYQKDTGVYELFLNKPVKNSANLLDLNNLEVLFNELREQMDYIIVDCSPTTVSTDAEVWMQIVDSALLVVRQDVSDIRIINDTVDMISQSGCDFSGFVLNGFNEENPKKDYGYDY